MPRPRLAHVIQCTARECRHRRHQRLADTVAPPRRRLLDDVSDAVMGGLCLVLLGLAAALGLGTDALQEGLALVARLFS